MTHDEAKLEFAAQYANPQLPHWIPVEPTVKQALFLALDGVQDVFYGGAAGSAKTVALLMAAARYVDHPDYRALVLRKNYKHLTRSGGLIDLSLQWWSNTAARWDASNYVWTFPSGARIEFGHLQRAGAEFDYQGTSYHCICVDELTELKEHVFLFLFRSLRQPVGQNLPLRMRSASNPVNIGYQWVKQRYVLPNTREAGAIFVPAKLHDNPHLDPVEYAASLAHLPPVLRKKMLDGDWGATEEGDFFKPYRWITEFADGPCPNPTQSVREWDLAWTDEQPGTDPDWTVGTRMSSDGDGQIWVEDVVRFRGTGDEVEQRIKATAGRDGKAVKQGVEADGGPALKFAKDIQRKVLAGYPVYITSTKGKSKEVRAVPWAAAMGNGLVTVVRAHWNDDWLEEHNTFPGGAHDDQVDSAVYGHQRLTTVEKADFGAAKGRRPSSGRPSRRGTVRR